MWQWLNDNAGTLSLIFAALPVAWAVLRYLALKRQQMRSQRFKVYHLLIRQLVEREEKDRPMMLDRQLAVVFELRRFPEYYEPTLRILRGLRQSWEHQTKQGDPHKRLLEEIEATIRKIEKNSKMWRHRILQFVRGL